MDLSTVYNWGLRSGNMRLRFQVTLLINAEVSLVVRKLRYVTELAKHPNSLASWRKLCAQFAQVEVVVGYNSMLYGISIFGMHGRTNRDVIEVLPT